MSLKEISKLLSQQAELICQELLPGGKKIGNRWNCGDATGVAGASMIVELAGERAGLWYDHATDDGGDMLDLIAANKQISLSQAASWAKQRLNITDDTNQSAAFDPLKQGWFEKGSTSPIFGSKAWPYHDSSGNIIAYVVRFDSFDGKQIIPLRLIDGKWRWKGWSKPDKNPIFNLHKITSRPNDIVLIVEGEKTAQAAEKIFPEYVVTTAQGGAKKFAFADWSSIAAREIILWPDADKAGRDAMQYLKARFPKSRIVDTSSLPDKWDLADPAPDGINLRGLIDGTKDEPITKVVEDKQMFRCLGHDEDGFHYLSFRTGRVESIAYAEHNELRLQCLAPDAYWLERGFYQEKGTGVDWKSVAKSLMNQQFDVGSYDPDLIRGRGCWLEGSSIIYHAGSHLLIDGKKTDLHSYSSKWIYPSRPRIHIETSNPLQIDDLKPFIELCDILPWKTPGTGWMLSSICYISSICGALDWRPSVWLKGPSGSGKSWTQVNVISRTIGPCINALSTTSAAGIRQALGLDALPVLFDECEAKDQVSVQRINGVLELLRQASSETGGSIYKGSPSGNAQKYKTRSIFIFSSIASAAVESADESRIANLEYKKRNDDIGAANFARVLKLAESTVNDSTWCMRFTASAIVNASLIRSAATVFLRAITDICGDARKGQQYGTLAAGRWVMGASQLPTLEQAKEWATKQDWDSWGAGSASDSDQSRATDVLLQAKCELIDDDGRPHRYNVGEALEMYFSNGSREHYAFDALMRMGIHPMRSNQTIDIANRHSELFRIFKETQFCGKWQEYFSRLDGATACTFTPTGGKTLRAVRIPRNIIMDSNEI